MFVRNRPLIGNLAEANGGAPPHIELSTTRLRRANMAKAVRESHVISRSLIPSELPTEAIRRDNAVEIPKPTSSSEWFKGERRGETHLWSKWNDFRRDAFLMRHKLLNTFEQAIQVGLNQVSIRSRLNPALLVSFIGRAGKEENRCLWIEVTDSATQSKAIEIRWS